MPAIQGVLLRLMRSEVTGARMSRGWRLVLSSQKVRPPASLPVGALEMAATNAQHARNESATPRARGNAPGGDRIARCRDRACRACRAAITGRTVGVASY